MRINNRTNEIYLIKGDTAEIEIKLYDAEGQPIEIGASDILTLTVKKNTSSSVVNLQKIASNGVFTIDSVDTTNLNSGVYLYDIQYRSGEGWVETVIPASLFVLEGDVTR